MPRGNTVLILREVTAAGSLVCVVLASTMALASPRSLLPASFDQVYQADVTRYSDADDGAGVPDSLRRQIVSYLGAYAPGTIVVDTPNTYLYYVLANGKAIRYGIGAGRKGFTWSGVKTVDHMSEWPDWLPPAEMIQRQPYLPRFVAGGPQNPLGARAIYLSGTLYRIHGTNAPSTIGKHVSSGCIRMLNEDVIDLYGRVRIGTKVVVLPMNASPKPARPVAIRTVQERVTTSAINSVPAFGLY